MSRRIFFRLSIAIGGDIRYNRIDNRVGVRIFPVHHFSRLWKRGVGADNGAYTEFFHTAYQNAAF